MCDLIPYNEASMNIKIQISNLLQEQLPINSDYVHSIGENMVRLYTRRGFYDADYMFFYPEQHIIIKDFWNFLTTKDRKELKNKIREIGVDPETITSKTIMF